VTYWGWHLYQQEGQHALAIIDSREKLASGNLVSFMRMNSPDAVSLQTRVDHFRHEIMAIRVLL